MFSFCSAYSSLINSSPSYSRRADKNNQDKEDNNKDLNSTESLQGATLPKFFWRQLLKDWFRPSTRSRGAFGIIPLVLVASALCCHVIFQLAAIIIELVQTYDSISSDPVTYTVNLLFAVVYVPIAIFGVWGIVTMNYKYISVLSLFYKIQAANTSVDFLATTFQLAQCMFGYADFEPTINDYIYMVRKWTLYIKLYKW